MATKILMPALSPTMEEGKLSKWLVKEGDTVKSGDILAEIETDKATMEFEAVDEGTIGKILVPEGTEGVKVNQPIAELMGEGEEAGKADIPSAMASIKDAVSKQASRSPLEGEPKSQGDFGGGAAAATNAPSPKRQEALRRSIAVAISTLKGRVEKVTASSRRRWQRRSPSNPASIFPR